MTDDLDESLKREIFWTRADQTAHQTVSEFAYYARHFILAQFVGSEEERVELEDNIKCLEPAIEGLISSLLYLKGKKRHYYNQAFQHINVLLSCYASIGVQHAFTQVVEVAALKPITEQRSKAGQEAARLRAETMVEPWHKLFDPIVKRIRVEKPELSNAALIREAREAYGTQGPKLPKTDRQLTTHVNDLIERDYLPAGPKDGRGRRIMKSTR